MLQYGVSSFGDDGCQNCKFYAHSLSRCTYNKRSKCEWKYVDQGLSKCGNWELGFVFDSNEPQLFRKIELEK